MRPGRVIQGKYRLEQIVGRGGMGLVWRAQHVELGTKVAVKVLSAGAEGDPRTQRRFKQEARAAAALRSDHVVSVRDYGVDSGSPYLVMELLEGESLAGRLARAPSLTLGALATFVEQAALALDHAHAQGFLHRDVKPSNLFLARTPTGTVLKVLDFGIAKSLRDADRDGNTLVGSPGYLSPEQARGEALDHTTDLWSLAAIIYRAVTGLEPFAAPSLAEMVERVCHRVISAPSALVPDLPAELDAFFERALCRSPARRFRSGAELSAAFGAIAREAPEFVPPGGGREPEAGAPRHETTQSWTPFESGTTTNGLLSDSSGAPSRRLGSLGVGLALLGVGLAAGLWLLVRLARSPLAEPGTSALAVETSAPAAAPAALATPEPMLQEDARLAKPGESESRVPVVARPAQSATAPRASSRPPAKRPVTAAAPVERVPPPPTLDPTFGLPLEQPEAPDARADDADSRAVAAH